MFAAVPTAQGFKLNGRLPASIVGDVRAFAFDGVGTRVIYTADQEEPVELFSVPVDRSTLPVRVDAGYLFALSPDGLQLIYAVALEDGSHLRAVVADGSAPPVTLDGPLSRSVTEIRVSADSQWAVYQAGALLLSASIDGADGPFYMGVEDAEPEDWQITADSQRVVFRDPIASFPFRHELYSVPIDASNFPLRLDGAGTGQGDVNSFLVTSDGSTVVFAATPSSEARLFAVPTDGSAPPVALSDEGVNADQGDFQLSPDGTLVFFQIGNTLQSAATDGSAPARVVSQSVSRFALTPDGLRVLYIATLPGQPTSALYVAPIDGNTAGQRLSSDEHATAILPSPDSAWVVYEARQTTQFDRSLFSAPIDGSAPARKLSGESVTNGRISLGSAHISPDSAWVAYLADHEENELFELYAVPIDGSQARTKLNDELVPGGDVATSPSFAIDPGTHRVAYAADERVDGAVELFVVDLPRQSPAVRLNEPLHEEIESKVYDFAVAPEDGRVVYHADEDTPGVLELFTVGAGFERSELSGPLVAGGDVISYALANGHLVYCADAEVDGRVELYGVPTAGGVAPVKLSGTMISGGSVAGAWIAPDGGRALYRASASSSTLELFSARTDGIGSPAHLSGALVAGGTVSLDPRISPDSTRVVYQADQEVFGVEELYSVAIDASSAAIKLSGPTDPAHSYHDHRITPDSAWLVYLQLANSTDELFSARLDGSAGPTRLHPTLVSGGDVMSYVVPSVGDQVFFHADLYVDNQLELFRVPVDGSSAPVRVNQSLMPGGDVTFTPPCRVSADGQRVVYFADPEGDLQWSLFSVPADGSASPIELDTPPGMDWVTSIDISPDSSRVVYRAHHFNAGHDLWTVAIDGSAPAVKLSSSFGSGADVTSFAISPDSDWVAYRGDLRQDGVFELFSAATDGSRPQLLESGRLPPGGAVGTFQLSPQPVVVFLADKEQVGNPELYLGFLTPQAWRARRDQPSTTRSFVR